MALVLTVSEDYMLPCLNKTLFGIECPGCGIQRSMALLMDGNFIGAFKMYPAIYTLLLLTCFLAMDVFIKFKWGMKFKIILIAINALIIAISYIIKMNQLF